MSKALPQGAALSAAPQTYAAAILAALLTHMETFDTERKETCVLVSFLVVLIKCHNKSGALQGERILVNCAK